MDQQSEYFPENELYQEIGRFIVEFENMLLTVKKAITELIENNETIDYLPIQILLQDSTSVPLSKYFQNICFHYVQTFQFKGQISIDLISFQQIIKKTSDQIIKAGELRNDIVHSSWIMSSRYGGSVDGKNHNLTANRMKLTSSGIEMRNLFLTPDRFNKSIEYLNEITEIIPMISNVICSKLNHEVFDMHICQLKTIYSIDFRRERENLFQVDLDYQSDQIKLIENYKKNFS